VLKVTLVLAALSLQVVPPLPMTIQKMCPFECCRFGAWTSSSRVQARASRSATASVAFTIAGGEVVTALDGLVVVTKAGVMRMNKAFKFDDFTAPPGAVIYLLRGSGEGYAEVWYEGRLHSAEVYAETIHRGNDSYPWDIASLPKSVWWVRVKNRRGQVGWLRDPSAFEGMDGCFVSR
jgi:hypothetical protein